MSPPKHHKKSFLKAYSDSQLQVPLPPQISDVRSVDVLNDQETRHGVIDYPRPSYSPNQNFSRAQLFFPLFQQTELPDTSASRNLFSSFQTEEAVVSTEMMHDDQAARPYYIMDGTPSTSYHVPPSLLSKSTVQPRLPQPVAVRQTVPIAQNHWQQILQAPVLNVGRQSETNIMDPRSILQRGVRYPREIQQNLNTYVGRTNDIDRRNFLQNTARNQSAAQNLANLARSYHSPHEQWNLSDYIQRYLDLKDVLINEQQKFNETRKTQNSFMRGVNVIPNESKPTLVEPSQFDPQQEYHNVLRRNIQLEQLLKQERLQRWTEAVHATQRSLFQNEYTPPQKKPNLLNPHGLPTDSDAIRQFLTTQRNYSHEPRVSPEPNEEIIGQNYMAQVPSFNLHSTVEPSSVTNNLEIQPTSSNEAYIQQFTPIHENHAYLQLFKKNIVVDRSTNTDVVTENTHFDGGTSESFAIANSPKLMESVCQVNEYLLERSSPHQEVDSDREDVTNDNIVLDHNKKLVLDEKSIESTSTAVVNDSVRNKEKTVRQSNRENNSTALENSIIPIDNEKIQKMHPRNIAEIQTLNDIGVLFSKLSINMCLTHRTFQDMGTTVSESCALCETLLKEVDTYTAKMTFSNTASSSKNIISVSKSVKPASSSGNVTEEVSQVTEQKQTGLTELEKTNDSEKYKDGAGAPKKARYSFIAPPEYDPQDSRWTLKYREPKPGLIVALLPHTRIYVKKSHLARIKKTSHDSRTLARQLLTEVFSGNALGVCSLTGGKAKAFINIDIKVRPGLDECGRMALLSFVEEYGKKKRWDTATKPIMSTIRTKLTQLRKRYEAKIYGETKKKALKGNKLNKKSKWQ